MNMVDATRVEYSLKQLSESPGVWICESFLTEGECQHLIQCAQDHLTPSVAYVPEMGGLTEHPDRKCLDARLAKAQDSTVQALERRFSELIGIPDEHAEPFTIIRYDVGGEYKAHHDYYDRSLPGADDFFSQGGQRIATAILYLNTVSAGGETFFPEANLTISPLQGAAVLFYSVRSDGSPDPKSLHGSLPLQQGEKWIATKWYREFPYPFS